MTVIGTTAHGRHLKSDSELVIFFIKRSAFGHEDCPLVIRRFTRLETGCRVPRDFPFATPDFRVIGAIGDALNVDFRLHRAA